MGRETIYGVSSGSYSDYRVLFLCSDKQIAEAAVRDLQRADDTWYSDACVEEFTLFDAPPKRLSVYTMQALVRGDQVLGSYGRHPKPELSESQEWEWEAPVSRRPSVRVYIAPVTGPRDKNITVTGTSKTAVLKAFSDRIAQMTAPFADGSALDE